MEKVPKCISNLPATYICMNEICDQPNPFICNCSNHDCQRYHKRCPKLQWILFKETLAQNRHPANPTFQFLCEKIEKIIMKGIEQFKMELEYFRQWQEQYGVVEKIEEFFECIQMNKEIRWTGKLICQLKNQKQIKFDTIRHDHKILESEIMKIESIRLMIMKNLRQSYQVQIQHEQSQHQE